MIARGLVQPNGWMHSPVGKFARRLGGFIKRRLIQAIPVRLRMLRSLQPITRSFGLDRGWPIDRHYIESFIAAHRTDIRGRVLEAGGLVNYTSHFGDGRVTRADVLYPKEGHADGTVVGDLVSGEGIPTEAYDCIVLTQVYPFIFDLPAAIAHTYRALKPNGVLLATVPGISQICRYDMQQWGDYWRFTDASARRLFGQTFGADNIKVEAYGNVLAACAFLHGLAREDLKPAELDYRDRDYQLSIAVRAVKIAKG